ncbi:MAG TPA: S8 family serine peptidase, partial [Anaerolineales bacterium]
EILQRLVDKVVDLGEAEMKDPDLAMFVDTPEWGPVPANQVLVLLDDTQGEADAQLLAQQLGGTIVGSFDYINLWQIEFPSGSADDLRAALTTAAAASGVTSAFPNSLITLDACNDAFDDPVFAGGAAAPYERIGVSAAWDYLKASGVPLSNVHIGLVDSALMLKDPNGRITSEFDNVSFPHGAGSTTDYWTDDEGYTINNGIWHANGVLGQIAGDMDDGGMVGIASPLGKQLSIEHTDIYRPGSVTDQSYPLDPELAEALGPKSAATTGRLMLDLKKQIEKGATIINGSFGPVHTGALNGFEAIAWKKFLGKIGTEHPEVLFVFSAGNEGVQNNGSNTWPGGIKLPNVMTVGSVQSDSTTTNYSNRTDPNGVGEVTLAAPGDQAMWGTGADGSIVNTDGGTSSAAPMVTAAAALVRAVDPSLSAEQIKILLEVTSDTGPADVGGKILRVDKAVLTAINTKRALAGLTPDLKAEDLKGLCEVQLSFKRIGLIEGWVEYEVTATLPKVGPAGSEVRIELGSNSVGGHGADPQKVTSSGGSVTFNVAGSQEGFGVIVTRLDTGAKARHYFQPDLTPTPEVTPTAAHQPRNACVGVTLADFHDNHINAIKCSLTCFLVGGPAPSDAEILDCIAKNSEP